MRASTILSLSALLLPAAALSATRFPPANPAATPDEQAVSAARDALRAPYALRGALFLLRLEAFSATLDAPARAALAPLLGLAPADAGFVAAQLARARGDLNHGRGQHLVVETAAAVAEPAARNALKAALRRAAFEPALSPAAPPPSAPAAKARLDAVAQAAAPTAFLDASKAAAAAARALPPAVAHLAAAKAPFDLATRNGLGTAPPAAAIRPLQNDAEALTDLTAAIDAELKALAPWAKSAGVDFAALASALPAADLQKALDPSGALHKAQTAVPPPVLDPEAVCRLLWDASCARLSTCHAAISNVVLNAGVCEEGADALIDACVARNAAGYADGSVTQAGLAACVAAWQALPCEAACAKGATLPAACAPFDASAPPLTLNCGDVRDEEGEDGLGGE